MSNEENFYRWETFVNSLTIDENIINITEDDIPEEYKDLYPVFSKLGDIIKEYQQEKKKYPNMKEINYESIYGYLIIIPVLEYHFGYKIGTDRHIDSDTGYFSISFRPFNGKNESIVSILIKSVNTMYFSLVGEYNNFYKMRSTVHAKNNYDMNVLVTDYLSMFYK